MDLGAFICAGRNYPVLFEDIFHRRPIKGSLSLRRGRPFWLTAARLTPDAMLSIRFELPGFILDEEASLRRAGPDDWAPIFLAGRVTDCRYADFLKAHVLRLDLMGRVLPGAHTL
jgi:hypothetical protein